ncbi:DUF4738 domain-containing protein [Siansivirga zeaxanthinifaciens]|nr:DUF4738 domain-containing protein [Siansivirga zeaxanthinifaciens]
MKSMCILLFVVISFIGCDGREKAYQKNQEVLQKAQLLESFSEQIKFIPENYTEIATDTTFSNGLQIKLNYHSLENDYVLKTSKTKQDTIIKEHFKNFEVSLQLFKNESLITEKTINKHLFSEFIDANFREEAIMLYVWVDHSSSTEKQVCLNTAFNIPNTSIFKDFVIYVNDNGSLYVKELKTTKTTI